jgi:hypothetical protein
MERIWKEAIRLSWRHYPGICLLGLRKTTRDLVTTVGIPAERYTVDLWSKSSILQQYQIFHEADHEIWSQRFNRHCICWSRMIKRIQAIPSDTSHKELNLRLFSVYGENIWKTSDCSDGNKKYTTHICCLSGCVTLKMLLKDDITQNIF